MATNKYRVYFKLFGEKKRMDVMAETKYEAEQEVLDKLEIVTIKLIEGSEAKQESKNTDVVNEFNSIFGNIFK